MIKVYRLLRGIMALWGSDHIDDDVDRDVDDERGDDDDEHRDVIDQDNDHSIWAGNTDGAAWRQPWESFKARDNVSETAPKSKNVKRKSWWRSQSKHGA
jgi:hypothetical protein